MSERVEAFLAALGRPPERRGRGLSRPRFKLDGLAARPWHAPRAFPWTRALERNIETIRAELAGIRRVPLHPEQQLVDAGTWRRFTLIEHGVRDVANCARCPGTLRLVDAVDGAGEPGFVYFSVLEPGTHVAPHYGPTNLRVRCHLPLIVPEGAALRVGRTTRSFREGQCLLFDDAFEHEAWNRGERARVVLIIDVWHPGITRAERAVLHREMRARLGPPAAPAAHVGAAAAFVSAPPAGPTARGR